MATSHAVSPLEEEDLDVPILDTHIHLFPASELHTLAWNSPGHPLWAQHSVDEYLSAVNSLYSTISPQPSRPNLLGFIFLETDRKTNQTSPAAWQSGPLAELAFLTRIALGKPRSGEGHSPSQSSLLKAIIPWAPIPAGPTVLGQYLSLARETAGPAWHLVKGFRYLVQDKPAGTMLRAEFIESLRFLGRQGFAFDLGVDFRSGGAWQLDEAATMLERVCAGVDEPHRPTVVVNHLCKPPMRSATRPTSDGDEDVCPSGRADACSGADAGADTVRTWRAGLARIAAFPNTFLKLSGCFSEIAPLPAFRLNSDSDPSNGPSPTQDLPPSEIASAAVQRRRVHLLETSAAHIASFLDTATDLFGTHRVVFGSDWPVCKLGGGGGEVAWRDWLWVARRWARHRGLTREEVRMVFAGNAVAAYNLEVDANALRGG